MAPMKTGLSVGGLLFFGTITSLFAKIGRSQMLASDEQDLLHWYICGATTSNCSKVACCYSTDVTMHCIPSSIIPSSQIETLASQLRYQCSCSISEDFKLSSKFQNSRFNLVWEHDYWSAAYELKGRGKDGHVKLFRKPWIMTAVSPWARTFSRNVPGICLRDMLRSRSLGLAY